MSAMRIIILTSVLFFLLGCQSGNTPSVNVDRPDHVIIIGVDGMSPDGIKNANTPNMDRLVKGGASTFGARAVMPSSSSPNWASMIMGAGPEQHGVTSNAWLKDEYTLPATVTNEYGFFPTIFSIIRKQIPDAEIGAIYHWDGFGNLFEQEVVDYSISPKTEEETAQLASTYLMEEKPAFCFIHFDHVDGAGHSKGHGTPAYYSAVEKADTLIGQVVAALEEAQMLENSLIILTADHGGIGFGHGGETPEEVEIPFILFGKGIKPGYEIQSAVNTYDNAATVAFALGLTTPNAWIGRPVKEAFVGFPAPTLTYQPKLTIRQPVIYPEKSGFQAAGGIFIDSIPLLTIKNPNEQGVIKYTMDGTPPTVGSIAYYEPVPISATTVVKAAIFDGDQKISRDEVGYFRWVESTVGHGVKYQCYEVDGIEMMPDFKSLTPVNRGETLEFHLTGVELPREEQVAVVFESYLEIEKAGEYQFFIASDDGSKFYVNGKEIINHDGNHGVTEKTGNMTLEEGRHLVLVEWFNSGGGMGLYAYYKGPGVPKQIVPVDKLWLDSGN